MRIDDVLARYIECALWSTDDESDEYGGAPLNINYGPEDIAPESVDKMRNDCDNFLAFCRTLGWLNKYTRDAEQFGHDFWLTRNGHGSGFWARGDGQLGEMLSKAAKTYGECNLYVGNDGKIYIS